MRSLKQIEYGSRLYFEAVFFRIATDVVGFCVQHGIPYPSLAAKPGQLYRISSRATNFALTGIYFALTGGSVDSWDCPRAATRVCVD